MTDLPTPPMGVPVGVQGAVQGAVAVLEPERAVVRPNRLARYAASALILATSAVAGLVAWQSWRSYHLVRDVLSRFPTVTAEQVAVAEQRAAWLSWAWLGGLALSWVAFAVWLWRARVNAARVCDAGHRLRIRWAVLAWVVPVANLWWPQMVLADVHRASRPSTPERGARLAEVRGSPLVGLWWAAFLAAHAVDLVALHLIAGEQTERVFRDLFVATAASAGLTAVAAVAALVLMRRIDRWQDGRPAIR
ncbi:DUF4328 domain-containing protein [Actinokineospora guangxiensis]|uniref:DUF4328 domain-containing protein n=1 Tax=Actinokineospora guangxiensis TaxID=1490288 RepID=A0ABW0EKC4_9PSEU